MRDQKRQRWVGARVQQMEQPLTRMATRVGAREPPRDRSAALAADKRHKYTREREKERERGRER